MRSFFGKIRSGFVAVGVAFAGCVTPEDQLLNQRVNLVVVDGTITNLDEPQVVWLNRSRSDPTTGRFGTLPLSGVRVEIRVDSSRVVRLRETAPGRYQAPESFRGEVGHRYQLLLALPDGSAYESSVEVMPPVPPVARVYERFDANSLPSDKVYHTRAANEFFIDWQDPADARNYYRWDWKLWERQDWCRTCIQSSYFKDDPSTGRTAFEDCFIQGVSGGGLYYVNDYPCRTRCWEIVRNYDTHVSDDQLTNGRGVFGWPVAQIPYFQDRGCLVEIRQSSLTQAAYRFYKQVQEQTQNNGGLVDTPPTATVGNVHNPANRRERVVGYFAASAVAPVRYWLDRRANSGRVPGLFQALNGLLPSLPGLARDPNTDTPKPPPAVRSWHDAVCVPSDSRTPQQPEGWRDF